MEEIKSLQEFFGNLKCPKCHKSFGEECVSILRSEFNYNVVKVACSCCDKSFGMALLGLELADITQMQSTTQESASITSDEVIDAHLFFSQLGGDWAKHLPPQEA